MKTKIIKIDEDRPDLTALAEGGRILQEGGLVAFPTETVYGLGGQALDGRSSKKIYAAKGRPSDNPLIIHIADLEELLSIVEEVPAAARRLAKAYWPGPLTMIFPKNDRVPFETTGGLKSVAVRMPAHRTARELIRLAGGYVAAPSANVSGRPSPTEAKHVIEDLEGKIDMIIDGGRVGIGLESTIVDFTEDIPVILRPGYINEAMLREVLGEVRMDPGLISDDSELRPKAPGMKYRHYAPKAELVIVQGEAEKVQETIRNLAEEKESHGQRVGILAADESLAAYPLGLVKNIGRRAEEASIARSLYGALRDFDSAAVDFILSESFDTPEMGDAIMNRLLKAAGHQIIQV